MVFLWFLVVMWLLGQLLMVYLLLLRQQLLVFLWLLVVLWLLEQWLLVER